MQDNDGNKPQPDFVRPREVSERLGLGKTAVKARIKDGSIPSRKLGGARLIPRSWLDQLATRASSAITVAAPQMDLS